MIRRAEDKDIPEIEKLLKQVLMVHQKTRPDIFKKDSSKYTEEELTEIIADEDRPVFCYTDENDHVLGYAFCVYEKHDSHVETGFDALYIDDICVDEEHRGMHIGESLYRYVTDYAKEKNIYHITLNVWECNPMAKAFYEKMGLKPYKTAMEMIL